MLFRSIEVDEVSQDVLPSLVLVDDNNNTASLSSKKSFLGHHDIASMGGLIILKLPILSCNDTSTNINKYEDSNVTSVYFTMENGLRRRFPDEVTASLHFPQLKLLDIISSDDLEFVCDLPVFKEQILSWKNNTLYKLFYSREVFVISGFELHSINSVQVMFNHGLDFEDVNVITDVEFNQFPIGDPWFT